MTTDRRRRIESLCVQALSGAATGRTAFLDEACGGDAELRREVESMLAVEPDAPAFLETPAWEVPAAPLAPGSRLGPYEIRSLVGAGGMGVVYKARDTRLDRTVAIKILPPAVAADPERRARFEVEAKTIAGLSHSHICTLYDVGDHDGSMFLVMEHLSGETLAERLRKGPLPPQQVLTTAAEIADALAAAHRQGVVHRDLKPGNVMLTKSGGAKLLDFGLAKLKRDAVTIPTASRFSGTGDAQTEAGTVLGTVPYMAPEQIEGKEADPRSDIFSLGAVLYEMLAGRRAFEGESHADVAVAILEREPPPILSLQPEMPPMLERLVRQCLAKSPDDRPDSAHDVANDLRWIRDTTEVVSARTRPRRWSAVPAPLAAAAVLAALMLGAGAAWFLRPALLSPTHPSIDVRPADALNGGSTMPLQPPPTPGGSRTAFAWTADGRALVFVGRRAGAQQLYVRPFDAEEARPLRYTQDAESPAVSPDGQWVAFLTDGKIGKVRLDGGPSLELVATTGKEAPWGLAWADDDRLYYGDLPTGSIVATPAKGQGSPELVTKPLAGELRHCLPQPLPGARALLYTVRKGLYSWVGQEIVVQTLATGERKTLLRGADDARYVASAGATGHLVFLRRGKLCAVAFDPERLELIGSEAPVIESVAQALTGVSSDLTGEGQYAVSRTGYLAWVPGLGAGYPLNSLVRVSRTGEVSRLPAEPRPYMRPVRLSSDGRRLAVLIGSLDERSVWVYELDRPNAVPRRLTRGDEAFWPIWSADGQNIVFLWLKDGRFSLAELPADGSGPPRRFLKEVFCPASFLRDGSLLAVQGLDGIVKVTREGRVEPLVVTPEEDESPELSPDGRWLAYGSSTSGRMQVYVAPYPLRSPADAQPVSTDGGESPAWHPNGRELFFLTPATRTGVRQTQAMMAATFSPGPPPSIGRPTQLFLFDPEVLGLGGGPLHTYQVDSTGQFYGIEVGTPLRPPDVTHVNLIENWFEELRAKAPPRR